MSLGQLNLNMTATPHAKPDLLAPCTPATV
jgi:hypothetical protein